MGKHKKNKVKKEKTQHVYRTLEQRKEEVRKIIDKLNELQCNQNINSIVDSKYNKKNQRLRCQA